MAVSITFSNSYFWLDSWVLANIIQLGTQSFCDRFVDYKIDPGRRLFDQMIMAARSVPANIAEGNSRHDTSLENEMRLTDVARASLCELQGDYFNFVLRSGTLPWSIDSEEYQTLMEIRLDRPNYGHDLLRDVGAHIRTQKQKFDRFIENSDPTYCANALMYLSFRLVYILRKQLGQQLSDFRIRGGFSENMTETRLQAKKHQSTQQGSPVCQVCGAPMVKRVSKKGIHAGETFWSCSNYHKTGCKFIIPIP